MVLVEAKARRWGNSLGLILPKDITDSEHIRENATVRFLLVRDSSKVLKETFGMLKGKLKKPTQQIKDELRAELYDD
jgi:antitoxin component of MazEF toxin-antitoxin module